MNKPFTLKVQETRQKFVEIINEAGTEVPAFCIKVILQDVLKQIEDFDNKEIIAYNQKLEEERNKSKKEDNNGNL